jgi:hypothetical protein
MDLASYPVPLQRMPAGSDWDGEGRLVTPSPATSEGPVFVEPVRGNRAAVSVSASHGHLGAPIDQVAENPRPRPALVSKTTRCRRCRCPAGNGTSYVRSRFDRRFGQVPHRPMRRNPDRGGRVLAGSRAGDGQVVTSGFENKVCPAFFPLSVGGRGQEMIGARGLSSSSRQPIIEAEPVHRVRCPAFRVVSSHTRLVPEKDDCLLAERIAWLSAASGMRAEWRHPDRRMKATRRMQPAAERSWFDDRTRVA